MENGTPTTTPNIRKADKSPRMELPGCTLILLHANIDYIAEKATTITIFCGTFNQSTVVGEENAARAETSHRERLAALTERHLVKLTPKNHFEYKRKGII